MHELRNRSFGMCSGFAEVRGVKQRRALRFRSAVMGLAALALAGAAQAADLSAGKAAFGACASCHALDARTKRLGPPLSGLPGRKAGAVEGYAYSTAMKTSAVAWTPANLDKFLAAPKTFMPGTKMVFPGLRDANTRANLIAYLAAQK